LTKDGYIKRTSMQSFTRSGGEKDSSGVKEGDYVTQVMEVNTLHNLLIFTQKGQYFLLPVHQIPDFKWKDAGTAIVNVINLSKEDVIVAAIPVANLEEEGVSLVFVTRKGQVKRTELKEYMTKRTGAVAACKVGNEDEIISVHVSRGDKDIVLVTKDGMSIRFREQEVNAMGRVSAGVRGIQLKDGDEVVSALWVEEDEGEILTVTDLGYGKRSLLVDYLAQSRGGKGMATFEFKEGKRVKPNGNVIKQAYYCKDPLNIQAISSQGQTYTFSSDQAPIMERKSIGKILVHLDKNDVITDLIVK